MNYFDFNMNGSEFLLFYAALATMVTLLSAGYLHRRDATRTMVPPDDKGAADAYAIAYLNEQEKGLAQATTVALVERGYLQISKRTSVSRFGVSRQQAYIAQVTHGHSTAHLSPLEQAVYNWFRQPRDTEEYAGNALPTTISTFTLHYEESLQQQRLLQDSWAQAASSRTLLLSGSLLASVGLLRIAYALDVNQPITYLLILLAISAALLHWVCRSNRVSARGRAYQAKLRASSESLTFTSGSQYALATAIFGSSALVGTPLADLQEFLHSTSTHSSASAIGESDGGGAEGCGGCGCGG